MTFSNNVSFIVKMSTFYIIMTQLFIMALKGLLNYTISFESYVILMRIENQKTTINNKVRATEQKFVLDPVK